MSEYDFTGGIGDAELAELAELRTEKWRDAAVKAHPEAAPFRDMLVAGSEAAMLDLAGDLAGRVSGRSAAAVDTPAVPVGAGMPALDIPTADEEMAEIVSETKRTGDWTRYLREKFARAGVPYPGGS